MNALWLVLLLGVSIWTFSLPVSGNHENDLANHFLNISHKNARHLKNSTDTMEMQFDLVIHSFAIDEPTQTLTVIAFAHQYWTDPIMSWEPKEYGGVSKFAIHSKDVWTPDITLYNSADGGDVVYGQGHMMLGAKGHVNFVRTGNIKVICDGDSLRFPFDSLNCSMNFGSWLYSGDLLNISPVREGVDISEVRPNPMWTIGNAKVKKVTTIYACCPEEPWHALIYKISFLRCSRHYLHILVIPCFLLSILTILLFLLPTHRSERITLGVLLFCAFFVLLVYTSSLVTVWTQLPYFVSFLLFNLIVITMFTFLHALILKLAVSENGQEVPKIVRTVMFEMLARILCMRSFVERNRSRHLVVRAFHFTHESGKYNKLTLSSSEKQPLNLDASKVDSVDELPGGEPTGQQTLESDVASIRALTSRLGQKMKDGEHDKEFSREWKDLAAVVNRLFFLIYQVVVTIAIGVVYIQISA